LIDLIYWHSYLNWQQFSVISPLQIMKQRCISKI